MKSVFYRSIILISSLLLMLFAYGASASAAWTGSGTSSSPYRLSTEADLKQLATNVRNGSSYSGKYFVLGADITLSGEWSPIGTSSTAFRGSFDGNSKTISGMTVNSSYGGLFGYIGNGAVIRNINLTGISVMGAEYLAGIAAHADAGSGSITVSGCNVSGTIYDNKDTYPDGYLGGILGYADAKEGTISITDCTSDCTISCSFYSGGILGCGYSTDYRLKITDCTNNSYINAGSNSDMCGGIAGYTESAEITGCINYGNVAGNAFSEDNGSSQLGGITGDGENNIFKGCANHGNISTFFAGGMCGTIYGTNTAISCINTGTLTHSSDGFGYSFFRRGTRINCFSGSKTSFAAGEAAYYLREYFGQELGVDQYPVKLNSTNRVYKVTVTGETNNAYFVNHGDTIAFHELSECAAYYNGEAKFNTSTAITRDYALYAKGYHTYTDGICRYCGCAEVNYIDTGYCGTNAVWRLDKNGCLTISGGGEMTDYTSSSKAPWSAYADKITSISVYSDISNIGSYAFYGLYNVTSVSLAESVKRIGSYSFYGLTSLTSFDFNTFIEEIGSYAFSGSGLTSFIGGSYLKTIGDFAFYQCPALESASFKAATQTIGKSAFRKCTSLDYIYFNNGAKNISEYAFADTALESIVIPDSTEIIGSYAFSGCSSLKKVSFEGNAPTISSNAFYGISASCLTPDYDSSWDSVINKNYGGTLTWAIARGICGENAQFVLDYSGTLTISGTGQMYKYSYSSTGFWENVREQIKKVVISDGITWIGDYAFAGCTKLQTVEIADSVTAIGTQGSYSGYGCVFLDCTSLTQINIPAKVSVISYSSFHGCENLTAINVASGNTTYTSENGILYSRYKTVIYCYPAGKESTFTIPSSVAEIASYAFAGNEKLTQITIPAGVTDINSEAFSGCTSLNKVTFLGNAPTYLGSYAFLSVNADAYIPANDTTWTTAKMKSFSGRFRWHIGSGSCGSAANWELILENSAMTLTISGSGAMTDYEDSTLPWKDYVSAVTNIVVSDGITSISTDMLYNGTSLTSVTLADTVKSIGDSAFSGCSSLRTLSLGSGLQTIGRYSFYGCKALTTLTLGNNMQSIGYTAFAGCTSLSTVNLGSSIKTLEQSAFNGCTALTKIVIPASVTSIGTYAFKSCAKLYYVQFLGNAPTFNSNAFYETTCNAYYSSSKSGWTSSVRTNYGGNVTWGVISYQGKAGSNAEWIIDTNGRLYICGQGYMPSYSSTSKAPWNQYASSIKYARITGLSSVGSSAFEGCTSLIEITLAPGISSVEANAFASCPALRFVYFEGRSPSFNSASFKDTECEGWYNSTYSWSSSSLKDFGGTVTWRKISKTGTCGTSAKWVLDTTGTLIIYGSGAMTSFTSQTSQPWYSDTVNAVITGDGITAISSYAFRYTAITSAEIGKSVTTINSYAFANCSSLTDIYFRGNAPSTISQYAFNSVTATAFYPINSSSWTSSTRQNYGGTLTWRTKCYNHNEVTVAASEPTCTSPGYTAGTKCSICNAVLTAQTVIPAKGHYVAGANGTSVPADSVNADCANDILCTVCKGVAKPAAGHRAMGTVKVEKNPIEKTSSYLFTLTDGIYYSSNTANKSSSSVVFKALYDCTLQIEYGVSSEERYDILFIYHNNSSKVNASGEETGTLLLNLKAGDTVKVNYKKDDSDSDGKDQGWAKLIYGNVMVDAPGEVSADTLEPGCEEGVVCMYCNTLVKEAAGHRIIVETPAVTPIRISNSSSTPFNLVDGIYYSQNKTGGSSSSLTINAVADCTITINYGVSSEPKYDILTIKHNSTILDSVSGIVSSKTLTIKLSKGDIVIINYSKDGSVSKNDDEAWAKITYTDAGPVTEIIPASEIEATCDDIMCDFCDGVAKEGTGHIYSSEITTPATHLKEGVMTYTCNCGDSYTEAIDKLSEHTYNTDVTPPGCVTKGYTTYTCLCGDTYKDNFTDETGHSHIPLITTPATHLKEGVMTYTCNCGDSYTEAIDKLSEHSHTSEITTPATHITEGIMTFTCPCGDTYTEAIEKLSEHSHFEAYVIDPDCENEGYTVYLCECGDTYKDNHKDKLPHTTENGICEGCDTEITDCDCLCHNKGLRSILWKIFRLLCMLFNINKACPCGDVHY